MRLELCRVFIEWKCLDSFWDASMILVFYSKWLAAVVVGSLIEHSEIVQRLTSRPRSIHPKTGRIMNSVTRPVVSGVIVLALFLSATAVSAQEASYDIGSKGTRFLEFTGGASSFKILLGEANLGGQELEIAEHAFAPGTNIGGHAYTSIEIFYVLSGELEHTVNGETVLLTPGMVGVVRNGDEVIHRVPSADVPARVLIIWTPAGEIERIFSRATERKIQ